MTMITRLKVSGYKSLKHVELQDLPDLVVLFGPNSAGKSNLLDALDLLAHLATEDTLVAAFQNHRGNRLERPLPVRWFFFGGDDYPSLSPREIYFELDILLQPRIVEEINSDLEERERQAHLERPYTRVTQSRLRYELRVQYVPSARALHVVHESLAPLRKDNTINPNIVPYIKHKIDNKQISVKLERQSHPRFYDLPRTRTLLSEIGDAVNHPHLVATARELASLRIYYVEPARMRSAVSDIEATDPGPHGEQLSSFYYWLKRQHPGLFENLVYNLGKIVPGITGLDVREATEGFLELWIKERETGEFPAAMVSEGTLRLLCLLGIAATPKAPALVGYEEPENGVNPARLSEMLSILENAATSSSGTQFLITTHSPSVINFFPDAKRIYCSKGPSGSEYVVYPELPLFRDLDVEYTLGTIQTAVSRLGDQFRRGDLG